MTPDFTFLAEAARRCAAVYIEEADRATAAFVALGSTAIDRYHDDTHQAVLHRSSRGRTTLTISGTRIGGTLAERIADLAADIDYLDDDPTDGVRVARGALTGLADLWRWVVDRAAPDLPIDVEGHSLGGWRAVYTPLFLASDRIGALTAFEPPKAGDAAFWAKYPDLARLTTVVHGYDPCVAWPPLGDLIQRPGRSLLWLHDGTWTAVSEADWPGGDIFEIGDHDIERVGDALARLAGMT